MAGQRRFSVSFRLSLDPRGQQWLYSLTRGCDDLPDSPHDLQWRSRSRIGEGAKIQLRINAYNLFNKLNLAPFTFGSGSTTISFFNDASGNPVSNPQFG